MEKNRWFISRSFRSVFILFVIIMFGSVPDLAYSQGLGMCGPSVTINAAAVYCQNHGGCPSSGKCYFPDGSYCDLWSFYNGTCPSRSTIEQSIWEAETYQWLNNDYSGAIAPAYTARSWMDEGNRLYILHRYQESLFAFESAINLEPLNANAWLGKGYALEALGRASEANLAMGKANALQSH